MLRFVGIVALIAIAACGQNSTKVATSPSPVIAEGNWYESLMLTGDVPGHITGIMPDTDTQQSTCSGSKTRLGEVWADSFFAALDSSGNRWQVTFVIEKFRGPGAYAAGDVNAALQSPDNTKAWLNQAGDKITFTIDRSQQSGTIDASLTNAATGKTGSERITGQWNCRG